MDEIIVTEDHQRGSIYADCKSGDTLKLTSTKRVRMGAGDYAFVAEQGLVDTDYAEMIVKEKK